MGLDSDKQLNRQLIAVLEDMMTAKVLPDPRGPLASVVVPAAYAASINSKPWGAEGAALYPVMTLLNVLRYVDVIDMPPDWPWTREQLREAIHQPLALERFLKDQGAIEVPDSPPGPPLPTRIQKGS